MKNISLLLLVSCLCGCSDHLPTIVTGHEGKAMPSVNLLLMDSATRINTNAIPTDKSVVLFLFNPGCPYCRAQTEALIEHMETLSNIQFYFISSYPFVPLKSYYVHYRLDRYPNVIVGQDYTLNFNAYFNVNAVPYLAFYDKDKRLKQVLLGQLDIDVLKKTALE